MLEVKVHAIPDTFPDPLADSLTLEVAHFTAILALNLNPRANSVANGFGPCPLGFPNGFTDRLAGYTCGLARRGSRFTHSMSPFTHFLVVGVVPMPLRQGRDGECSHQQGAGNR
jgi:hypothetical protein